MRNLIIGLVIGLMFSACCVAHEKVIVNPLTMVHTDRYFVYTTKVTTEEGTYRLFTYETNEGGGGITAVKIK